MAKKRKCHAKRHERMADVDEATIRLHIEPLSEGGYLATSPDVPGLVAEGRSITEAVEIAQGLTRKIVESCIEHGDPLRGGLVRLFGADREGGSSAATLHDRISLRARHRGPQSGRSHPRDPRKCGSGPA
jgi:antitoxin HicB